MALPDLSLVAVFVRVVELESFTSAAKALGLPKSSVSRSVAQLEEALGVRLLQRTSRKLSLTDEGRAFVERVREPLGGLLDAMADAAESQRTPRGLIRLTAPPDLANTYLAEHVAEFVQKYPLTRIEFALTTRMVDLVAERFDLAIRATQRLEDSTLVARKVGVAVSGLFASAEYVKRHGRPRTLADLADHECVLFRAHSGTARWRLAGPNGDEEVAVRGAVSADDLSFVHRVVAAGGGVGLLPIDSSESELTRLLPNYASEFGALFIVMPSGRHVPARVALLRDFLHEKLIASRALKR